MMHCKKKNRSVSGFICQTHLTCDASISLPGYFTPPPVIFLQLVPMHIGSVKLICMSSQKVDARCRSDYQLCSCYLVVVCFTHEKVDTKRKLCL